jgi:hypothetical protein
VGDVPERIVQIMRCCTWSTGAALGILIVNATAVQKREWIDRRIAPTCGNYYFWNKPHAKPIPDGVVAINRGWIGDSELTNVICHLRRAHRHLCIDADEIDAKRCVASAQPLKLWLIVVADWTVCGNE